MRALRRASLGDVFAMLNDGIFASCGAKNLELKASPSFEYLLLVSFLLFFIILYYSLLFFIIQYCISISHPLRLFKGRDGDSITVWTQRGIFVVSFDACIDTKNSVYV